MRAVVRAAGLLTVAALLAATAQAVPYVTEDGRTVDLEYVAGSGANQAVVVIDFRGGRAGVTPGALQPPGDSFAFGFAWDDPINPSDIPTGLNALEAIAAAGGLTVFSTDTVFGTFIDGFEYLGHQTTGWLAYFLDGMAEEPAFGLPALDPQEGLGWELALIGAGGRPLADQFFDGWADTTPSIPGPSPDYDDGGFGFNYIGPAPRVPLAGGQEDVIPEPATLAMLTAGLLALCRRRKRR